MTGIQKIVGINNLHRPGFKTGEPSVGRERLHCTDQSTVQELHYSGITHNNKHNTCSNSNSYNRVLYLYPHHHKLKRDLIHPLIHHHPVHNTTQYTN